MENKYSLTEKENMFLARKRGDESVYSGMRMEDRKVTFPQTQTILEGINVAEVALDDVQAILNMRDAWKYLLAHLALPLDIDYLCKLQEKVAYREALVWGELRTGSIGISGVAYIPPIPDMKKAENELANLLAEDFSATEKALDVFAWTARSQLFWEGNKRTAMLAANKILIENGAGILLVPDGAMAEFSALLGIYYESGDSACLKAFLYETALFGIDSVPKPLASKNKNPQTPLGRESERRTAAWLKCMRKEQGLTQKSLAHAIGVAPNSLANIEQKQRKGSNEMWSKIEDYFEGTDGGAESRIETNNPRVYPGRLRLNWWS